MGFAVEGSGTVPMAWTSPDGVVWTPARVAGTGALAAVTGGPAGYVAVGRRTTQDRAQAAVWTSADGRDWRLAGELETSSACSSAASDVAWGPRGVAAVGVEWGEGACTQHAAAWQSSEGVVWARASVDRAGNTMSRVSALTDGFVSAGADNAAAGEGTHAMFWSSPTGRAWTAAPDHASFASAQPAGLVLLPDSTVLSIGMAIERGNGLIQPVLWRRGTDHAWERATAPGLTGVVGSSTGGSPAASSSMTLAKDVLAPDGIVLATGATMSWNGPIGSADAASPWRYVIWASSTGTAWSQVPDDPLLEVGRANTYVLGPDAAVVFGDRLLLFGSTFGAESTAAGPARAPTIWSVDLTSLAPAG